MNTLSSSTLVLLTLLVNAPLFTRHDGLMEEMYRDPKGASSQSARKILVQPVSCRTDTVRVVLPDGGSEDSWSAEDFGLLPQGNWTLLGKHDRGNVIGGVNEGVDLRDQSEDRVFLTSPPGDSKPAFEHRVTIEDTVDPLGVDSSPIPFDPHTHERVLLRYHMWLEEYSGVAGKYMHFGIGRGWIAKGYGKQDDSGYGTAGGGANTMQPRVGSHPDGGKNNGVRLLASFSEGKLDAKYYGELKPNPAANYVPPTGRWVPVDIIIDKNNGYELRVNGEEIVKTRGRNPIVGGAWTDCHQLWWRVRLMHGGTPSHKDYKPVRNYSHWFGGFFVYAE